LIVASLLIVAACAVLAAIAVLPPSPPASIEPSHLPDAANTSPFYEEIGAKGGQTTSSKYGHEFYEEIGHKGGQKVKELIERGKAGG
jgi:general stress protein YciG